MTSSKYGTVDNKTVLELADDAAHVNWGGNWRMPTTEEAHELRDNVTATEETRGGVKCYILTSKIYGNSIVVPMGGVYCVDRERLFGPPVSTKIVMRQNSGVLIRRLGLSIMVVFIVAKAGQCAES